MDASLATVKLAIAAKADLLIVHHGLFWNVRQPWTGKNYELFRLLVENNLAVYSSHLPLDFHPKLGNNVILCAALGLKNLQPISAERRTALSVFNREPKFRVPSWLPVCSAPLEKNADHSRRQAKCCERIGVVTGGAGDFLQKAAEEGVDTFVTGEGPHWTYALAEELGVNVLYGGHYATETFGVKALATHLSKKFRLPWTFLDHPTGL